MDEEIRDLRAFLDASHSHCHALAYLRNVLEEEGYIRLPEWAEWKLVSGGKYFVQRGDTALTAFRIPEGPVPGFLMSASHCDRPCFKVKENFELNVDLIHVWNYYKN